MRYDLSTHTLLTDEELIRLAQAGDELAFSELMSRYSSTHLESDYRKFETTPRC